MKSKIPVKFQGKLKEINELLKGNNDQLINCIVITDLKETVSKNEVAEVLISLKKLPFLESIIVKEYETCKLMLKYWKEKVTLKNLTSLSFDNIPNDISKKINPAKKINLTFVGEDGIQYGAFCSCQGKKPEDNLGGLYFQESISMKHVFKKEEIEVVLNLAEAEHYDEKKRSNILLLAQTDVMIICISNPKLLEGTHLNEHLAEFLTAKKKKSSSSNILSKLKNKAYIPQSLSDLPVLIAFDISKLTKENGKSLALLHPEILVVPFNQETGEGAIDIIPAALENYYQKILLRKYKPVANMLSENRRTTYELYSAIKKNEFDKTKAFLKTVSVISKTSFLGNTPLHWAALYDNIEACEFLAKTMREGMVSLSIHNNKNQTPLDLSNNKEIIEILNSAGKDDESEVNKIFNIQNNSNIGSREIVELKDDQVIIENNVLVKLDKATQTETTILNKKPIDQDKLSEYSKVLETQANISFELKKINRASGQQDPDNYLQNIELTLLEFDAANLNEREGKLIQERDNIFDDDSKLKIELANLDSTKKELEGRLKNLGNYQASFDNVENLYDKSLDEKRKNIEVELQKLSEKSIELNKRQEQLNQLQDKLNLEQSDLSRDKQIFNETCKKRENEFKNKVNDQYKKQEIIMQEERVKLDLLEKNKLEEINVKRNEIERQKKENENSQRELQNEKNRLIYDRQKLVEEKKSIESNKLATEQEKALLKQKEDAINNREKNLQKYEEEIKIRDSKLTLALNELNKELEEVKIKKAALGSLSEEREKLEKRRSQIKKDQEEANRLKILAEKTHKKARDAEEKVKTAEELLSSQLHINPTNHLLKAVQKNNLSALEIYLTVGLDPNKLDEQTGNTFLHIIAEGEINKFSANAAKLLLNSKADPCILNKENKTPLQILQNRKYINNEYCKALFSILQKAEKDSDNNQKIDLFNTIDRPMSNEQKMLVNKLLEMLLSLGQHIKFSYQHAFETNIVPKDQLQHLYNMHGANCFSILFEQNITRLPSLYILRASFHQLTKYIKEADEQKMRLNMDLDLCLSRIAIMLKGLNSLNIKFDVGEYYKNYHSQLLVDLPGLSKDSLLQQISSLIEQDCNRWKMHYSFFTFDEAALKQLKYTKKHAKEIIKYGEKELNNEIKNYLEPQRVTLEKLIQRIQDLKNFCLSLCKIIDYEIQLSKFTNEQLKQIRAYYARFQEETLIIKGYEPHKKVSLQGHSFELWDEDITPKEEERIFQETGYKISRQLGTNKVQIGSGKTGTLYIGQDLESKIIVAIKEVVGLDNLKEVSLERIIHGKLTGLPNILNLIASGVDEDRDRNPAFYQVTPLADFGNGGRLLEKLRLISDPHLHLQIIRYIAQSILRGIVAMHEQRRICHLDIKPENFVIRKGQIYLIDFGFSKEFFQPNDNFYIKKEFIPGDTRYSAPERLAHERYMWNLCDGRNFSTQYVQEYDARLSDAWSVGILLMELLSLEHPLPVKTTLVNIRQAEWGFEFFEKVIYPQFQTPKFQMYEQLDSSLCEMIKELLQVDPGSRCTVNKALEKCQSAIFKDNEIEQIFEKLNNLSLANSKKDTSKTGSGFYFFENKTQPENKQQTNYDETREADQGTNYSEIITHVMLQ